MDKRIRLYFPTEFDYYLWKTEDGKFMARVKNTGEVCELTQEQFRLLRAEEKRVCRANEKKRDNESLMPVEETYEKVMIAEALMVIDFRRNVERAVIHKILMEAFIDCLTPKQEDVFRACIMEGMSTHEYARECGVHQSSVYQNVKLLRKKFIKIFS